MTAWAAFAINSTVTSLKAHTLLCPVCPVQETQIQFAFILIFLHPSFLVVSLRAVRPRLWREQRRVMFGLSVWLLVSVSGAAGSSDSAGGAAGPSRVQPSPCDTLSVTDPLRLVTRHPSPPCPRLCLRLPPPPQSASGLFTATLESLTQSVTYCLTEESLVGADLHVFFESWYQCFGLKLAIMFPFVYHYLYLLF